MSHIVEARTQIQNPDLTLLRQAVEIVAGTHEGGRVEDHFLDFGGRRQPVSTGLAVFTQRLHRGIGIEVDAQGKLSFKGDPWAVQDVFSQVQGEVVQTYVSLGIMQSLQGMAYATEASQEEQRIVIRGVTYA